VRVAQLVRQQQLEALQRERIAQELRVAHLVQQTLLPKAIPDLARYRLDRYYQPAREVGGDFYDFIELSNGRLGLVIGDVTDKGVPAALVMATTRSVLRAAAGRLESPGAVLGRINDVLYDEIPRICLSPVCTPSSTPRAAGCTTPTPATTCPTGGATAEPTSCARPACRLG